MQVAVIGGGAAGTFAAISVKTLHSDHHVRLFEKSAKLLSKVRVSGGGRCNVCHAAFEPRQLASSYPRGEKFLRRAFGAFDTTDTVEWFAHHGVELKTEKDGRMFPTTDDSGTIIKALEDAMAQHDVRVVHNEGIKVIERTTKGGFELTTTSGRKTFADRVIVTTGGHPKQEGYAWLKTLGHSIISPVPSLFTFNVPDDPIRSLMGVVVDPARVRIIGTSLESTGPLLITHWGMSGPVILRLSAWGAREVHEMNYQYTIQVNWLGGTSEAEVRNSMECERTEVDRKRAINANRWGLPRSIWSFLLDKASIQHDTVWGEIRKKERNRLIDLLTNDRYAVKGKTTFKEEFVTAGGVSLEEVDPLTMESKLVPGLYFAGEVLDIDGITGGFNFQAAWTTGAIAGRLGH